MFGPKKMVCIKSDQKKHYYIWNYEEFETAVRADMTDGIYSYKSSPCQEKAELEFFPRKRGPHLRQNLSTKI